MFSQPESAQISEKFVAVKMLGGQDLDDEGKAFMSRYGVQGYPTLLAMTADGAVVSRSFQRTMDGIIKTMEDATATNEAFLKEAAELSTKTDPESMRTLAKKYAERSQLDEAGGLYEKLVASKPTAEDRLAYIAVLAVKGDDDGRKAQYEALLEENADHEDAIDWRIELATFGLPQRFKTREQMQEVMGQRKERLTKLLAEVQKPLDQAAVRAQLGEAFFATGDRDTAKEHFQWILDNARKSKHAGLALLAIAMATYMEDPTSVENLEKAKELLDEVVANHADSPVHRTATMRSRQLGMRLEMLREEAEKKAKEAEEKKDDDDGGMKEDEDK